MEYDIETWISNPDSIQQYFLQLEANTFLEF